MGEKILVESQITDSILLIKYLDSHGYSPSFAFWYYYEDADEWRFIIAGKEFDNLLPQQEQFAYQIIAESFNKTKLSSINLSEVKIIKTDTPLSQTVKFLVQIKIPSIARAHFSNNSVNGIFIKEMIVLRSF